jgi:hypothetical protein
MRLIALLLVVGIIGFFWSRRASNVRSSVRAEEELLATPPAQQTQVSQRAIPAQPAHSGLRQPIDRTRSVLDKVKSRNGNGEF